MLCEMNMNLETIEPGNPKCIKAHCNLGATDIISSKIWGLCLLTRA